jgi:MFS superfamily sulfate permease-like transporter
VAALRQIWSFSRSEFAVALVATLGVLGGGLLNGVLFGVTLSLLLLIHRSSKPRVVELGRVPGTSQFADLVRHPENTRVPDVLVARTEGAILYFNADHVRDQVMSLKSARTPPPRFIVLFMGTVPILDLAGTEMLLKLDSDLRASGVAFCLAEAHSPVREALRRVHPGSLLAEANLTVELAVQRWQTANP